MLNTHSKIMGILSVLAAIVFAALPICGVDAKIVVEIGTIFASITAQVAAYFHESPEWPMPEKWQEIAGRIGMILGGLGSFVPIGARVLGLQPSGGKILAGVISAAAGILSAYMTKSPTEKIMEKKLSVMSMTTSTTLLLLVLMFPVSSFAAGITPLYPQPPASATKTSSSASAPSSPIERGILAALAKFDPCTGTGHGVCMTLPVSFAAYGFDRQFHALEIAAGIGASYTRDVGPLHLSAGLAVAPVAKFDHMEQLGEFALLANLSVYRGFGAGVLWRALVLGAPESGFKPPDKFHLAGFVGVDLFQAFRAN